MRRGLLFAYRDGGLEAGSVSLKSTTLQTGSYRGEFHQLAMRLEMRGQEVGDDEREDVVVAQTRVQDLGSGKSGEARGQDWRITTTSSSSLTLDRLDHDDST
jgi:hypothetical protein